MRNVGASMWVGLGLCILACAPATQEPDPTTGDSVCTPGSVRDCVCHGGRSGRALCDVRGRGFAPCDCSGTTETVGVDSGGGASLASTGGDDVSSAAEGPGSSEDAGSVGPSFDSALCKKPDIPPAVDAPFEIVLSTSSAVVGGIVEMSVRATEGELTGHRIDWFVDDVTAPPLSGTKVSHVYDHPGRFRIIATITDLADPASSVRVVEYLNVFRPYAETTYAQSWSGLVRQGRAQIGTPGSGDWCHHHYDVYRGKYYELWVQSDHPKPPSEELLLEALVHGDLIHEEYTDMFGWDLRTNENGQKMVLCNDVSGAGGGSGGMFWPRIRKNPDTGRAEAGLWAAIIHEFMHQWDFRGGLHLPSADPAHALTSSQEFLAYTLTDTTRVTVRERVFAVTPHYNDTHIERIMHHRYLGDDDYDWHSLYSPEIIDLPYDTRPLPENKDHMLVPAGILMALYRLHGPEGLRAYYRQIDRLLVEHPEWDFGPHDPGTETLSHAERTDNMALAMARALRLNVTPYFERWKFPLSDEVRATIAEYPDSPALLDRDGDGMSELDGDQDDCDPSIHAGATERMDGKDNNQDGLVDEFVVDEGQNGDVESMSVELPFWVRGRIDDLDDEDVFRFVVPPGKRAVVATLTLGAPKAVDIKNSGPHANRPNRLFSGSYEVDGNRIASIFPFSQMPADYGYIEGDGTESSIVVSARTVDEMNPNPGEYEFQVFIRDAVHRDTSSSVLIETLYPPDLRAVGPGDDGETTALEEDTGASSEDEGDNGDAGAATGKTRIFVLAGQSNMEGRGDIDPLGTAGTLSELVDSRPGDELFSRLRDAEGGWRAWEDVWVEYDGERQRVRAPLTVGQGFGPGMIGPELGFGIEVGEFLEDEVVIIKAAWGGRSLAVDFRPPSSGGTTGTAYIELLNVVDETIETLLSEGRLRAGEYEIAGFGWHQGWNDAESDEYMAQYAENLANLIRDLRQEWGSPELPVSIGTSGLGGNNPPDQWFQFVVERIRGAQMAVAAYPEFVGTVTAVDTVPFWREPDESPADEGHHWHRNAESFYRIGVGMGHAMVDLL